MTGELGLRALLLLHAASTWAMVGLIWLIQLVHYPLFHLASRERFSEFCERHQRRTTWVVGPLMLVEVATATLLLFAPTDATWVVRLGFLLVVSLWVSTAAVQVPLHGRLSAGYDEATIDRLVATNWFRTIVWTARGLIAGALLVE